MILAKITRISQALTSEAIAVALLLLTLASPACVHRRPAIAVPNTAAPAIEVPTTTPPDRGRLIIDVDDGPTAIQQVRPTPQPLHGEDPTGFRFIETPVPLCATSPCVVDLAPGNILLGFPVAGDPGALEVDLVHVGASPSVYRRRLSRYDRGLRSRYVLSIVATALGGTAAMTGAALLPVGLAKDSGGLTTAGAITLGAGLVATVVGILGIRSGGPSYRPGASVHFAYQDPDGPR